MEEKVIIVRTSKDITPLNSTDRLECPENKLIEALYPGRIVSIYSYLCTRNSTSGRYNVKAVIPSQVLVTEEGGDDMSQRVYQETFYDHPKDSEYGNPILFGVGITKNATEEPSRFGVLQKGSLNEKLFLKVSLLDSGKTLSNSQSFSFVNPRSYVKIPSDCSFKYSPADNIWGVFSQQGSNLYPCNVTYSLSPPPPFPVEYGILRLLKSGGQGTVTGGGQSLVLSDGTNPDEVLYAPIEDEFVRSLSFEETSLPGPLILFNLSSVGFRIASYFTQDECSDFSPESVKEAETYQINSTQYGYYLMIREVKEDVEGEDQGEKKPPPSWVYVGAGAFGITVTFLGSLVYKNKETIDSFLQITLDSIQKYFNKFMYSIDPNVDEVAFGYFKECNPPSCEGNDSFFREINPLNPSDWYICTHDSYFFEA